MPSDLPQIAGLRFRNAGKIFYFHTAGMRLEPGEYVVVESARGPEVAKVVISPDQVVVNEMGREELRPILRLATDEDIRRADRLRTEATELLPEARRLADDVRFPSHLEGAEFTLDGRRLTFSFASEERVDYRDFVRKAADHFGVKVDMRQVGARDRAKMAGGYGVCGRELCCSGWLTTFPSISIRMAKEQDLPLNPQKISGLCGRLLCCLSYEEEGYKEMRRSLPKLGQRCSTPTGEGKVISLNILQRRVTLIVDGQRVDVTDRDLGLVVRWDPSSKIGDPPPSISRQDAIAQGLIVATEEDEREAMLAADRADDWLRNEGTVVRDPIEGRGRLPGGGPRKTIRPKPVPNAAPNAAADAAANADAGAQRGAPNQARGGPGGRDGQGQGRGQRPQGGGQRPQGGNERPQRGGEPRPPQGRQGQGDGGAERGGQQPQGGRREPQPRRDNTAPPQLGGRAFQRSTPPPERASGIAPGSNQAPPDGSPAGDQPPGDLPQGEQPQGSSRRRGRRGGRGRGGAGGGPGAPPTE